MPAEDRSVRGNTIKPRRVEEVEYIEAEEIVGLFEPEESGFSFLEEAVTFAESHVSVTHDRTELSGESIGFSSGISLSDAVTGNGNGNSNTRSSKGGVVIEFTSEADDRLLKELTLDMDDYSSGLTAAYLLDVDGNVIRSITGVSSWPLNWTVDLTSDELGQVHAIAADAEGADWTNTYDSLNTGVSPEGTFDITNNSYDSDEVFGHVECHWIDAKATATVELANDGAVESWSLLTYQVTDSESITIDALENGSVVMQDVHREKNISDIDPAADTGALATFSRDNPGADPRLGYVGVTGTR